MSSYKHVPFIYLFTIEFHCFKFFSELLPRLQCRTCLLQLTLRTCLLQFKKQKMLLQELQLPLTSLKTVHFAYWLLTIGMNKKIINYWSSSSQDIVTSLGLILTSGPRVLRQAPCGMCNEDKQCQLLGCLHSICPNCIKGHSESRVMNGELNLRCPIPSCGKMAASSIFLHYLSREANVMFKQTMANDFLATKAQEKRLMSHVAESFLAKGCVLVQMFKGLALKLWRDKKNLIASFLLVLFFCNLFCLGNTLTCALELGLVNLFAAVFDVWANIIKVMLLCLLYKVFQSGLYSVWIVLVLSIACFSFVMLKVLGASAWFFLKNAILELLK